MGKKPIMILKPALSVILLSMTTFGDAAPDPGFKRISINLILETKEDLGDHRFFIKSGANLEEVFLHGSERTSVPPLGAGAYYSAGTLIAVPTRNLENVSDAPGERELSELRQAVYQGKVPGAVELLNHRFSREVSEAEAGSFQDPVYRIERDPQAGLRAVYVSGGVTSSEPRETRSSGLRFWQSAAAAVVAGIFLLFGITILGVLYFRKRAMAL